MLSYTVECDLNIYKILVKLKTQVTFLVNFRVNVFFNDFLLVIYFGVYVEYFLMLFSGIYFFIKLTFNIFLSVGDDDDYCF